jgi:hypothetical protein
MRVNDMNLILAAPCEEVGCHASNFSRTNDDDILHVILNSS